MMRGVKFLFFSVWEKKKILPKFMQSTQHMRAVGFMGSENVDHVTKFPEGSHEGEAQLRSAVGVLYGAG